MTSSTVLQEFDRTPTLESDSSTQVIKTLEEHRGEAAGRIIDLSQLDQISRQLVEISQDSMLPYETVGHAEMVKRLVPDLIKSISWMFINAGARKPEDVQGDLEKLSIYLSRLIQDAFKSIGKPNEAMVADRTTQFFLTELPNILSQLNSDIQAAYDGDPALNNERIAEIIAYPGYTAILSHRIAHTLHARGVPLIPRFLSEHTHSQTGIDIHPGAQIGKHFFIDHGTGVVIGETTEIGDNVRIYQGVTLGAHSPVDKQGIPRRGEKRHPTIKEGVIIYANATIIGGNTVIGANSTIGEGVSLSKSIPPNSIATQDKSSLNIRPRES